MSDILQTLLAAPYPPSLIYLHHPHHPTSALSFDIPPGVKFAIIDAIEHYNARLLYSGILVRLGIDVGEVATWDAFVRALREGESGRIGGKGKGKAKANGHGLNGDDSLGHQDGGVLIVITKAERLRNVLGGGWSVITRLAELSGVQATVILASSIPWDEVRPPRGDSAEPFHVYMPAPTREEKLASLLPGSSHPLYPRFLDLLLAALLPLTPTPIYDIHHLSIPLWQIYTTPLPPHLESTLLPHLPPHSDPLNPPPHLAISIKLLTDLKQNLSIPLSTAIEHLLPRQCGGVELVDCYARIPRGIFRGGGGGVGAVLELPLVGRYLVMAGYCASYNPGKSDLRLFGRGAGLDGKRRKGGGLRRAGYGRTRIGKVPQRLLGPRPFNLDRLLALFASLYAEHAARPEDLQAALGESSGSGSESDASDWPPSIAQATAQALKKRGREVERDERWEDEVDHLMMSAKLWSLIPELEAQGLLKRVSPPDRLDNIMLRCEVDYETAKGLAKDLKITLDEYLYEATS